MKIEMKSTWTCTYLEIYVVLCGIAEYSLEAIINKIITHLKFKSSKISMVWLVKWGLTIEDLFRISKCACTLELSESPYSGNLNNLPIF